MAIKCGHGPFSSACGASFIQVVHYCLKMVLEDKEDGYGRLKKWTRLRGREQDGSKFVGIDARTLSNSRAAGREPTNYDRG
jgi:hypothetical protein